MRKCLTAFFTPLLIFCVLVLLVAFFQVAFSGTDTADKPEPEKETISIGKSAMVEIGDGLWYNSETGIVYWWNGSLIAYSEHSTTPTPYYSPNGHLYRYNVNKNSLEEIK